MKFIPVTKDIVYYTYKHNYIYVLVHKEIQQHVSVLPVDHLQVEILTYRLVIPMCGAFGWPGGVGGETRSRYFNRGYHDHELLEVIFPIFVIVHFSANSM